MKSKTNYQPLTKEMIDDIFDNEKLTESSAILARIWEVSIYDWDKIEFIEGYPAVSEATSLYVGQRFIDFDRKHHPGAWFAGWIWISRGFTSVHPEVPNWVVSMDYCRVEHSSMKYRVSVSPDEAEDRGLAMVVMSNAIEGTGERVYTHTVGDWFSPGQTISCFVAGRAKAHAVAFDIETAIPFRVTVERVTS